VTEEQSKQDPRRSNAEAVLDLLFYAPIGLALNVREELPRLAEKGRQRLESQLTTARFVGQFAVNQGRREVERLVDRLAADGQAPVGDPANTAASDPVDIPTSEAGSSPASGGAGAKAPRPPRAQKVGVAAAATRKAPSPAALAIPGYDSLSASQVVQRLAGLSAPELESVRAYEATSRNRRTILTRISQLQLQGR